MAQNLTTAQQAQRRADQMRSKAYQDMLILNEGNKPQVYKDTKGNRSIGIGFNLEDKANQRFLKSINVDINELFKGRGTDRERDPGPVQS
jgi:hypothetical protein